MKVKSFRVECVLMLLIAAFMLGGCSRSEEYEPKKGYTYSVVDEGNAGNKKPSWDNLHSDNIELYKALEDNFQYDYIMINNYTMSLGYSNAGNIALTAKRFVKKAQLIREYLPKALESVYSKAKELYPDVGIQRKENISYPNWQYLAATLPYVENICDLLYQVLALDIEVDTAQIDFIVISVSVKPVPIYEFSLARAKEADQEKAADVFIDTRFTYAYLMALYNENGDEISSFPYYKYDDDYVETLTFPLSEKPRYYYDTWAQGRSSDTRKHMGTDIRQNEGAKILSCSDGIVLYVSYEKIPGNYVIIIDSKGYEYHYYHMVELSRHVKAGDTVKPGDLIGNVGCTGNSDADHLHIAIISPEGVFINPFNLMTKLESKAFAD